MLSSGGSTSQRLVEGGLRVVLTFHLQLKFIRGLLVIFIEHRDHPSIMHISGSVWCEIPLCVGLISVRYHVYFLLALFYTLFLDPVSVQYCITACNHYK